MAWPLAVVGTCHLDDIETPRGRRRGVVGGSAVYFALAAGRHVPVRLLGVVGADAESLVRATLAESPVELSQLTVSPLPTYRWRVRHHVDTGLADDADTPDQHSASDDWMPHLDHAAADAPVFFVASLTARLQREVLLQSRARLVGADTMVSHIAADVSAMQAVVRAADLLFVNQHELRALVPGADHDMQQAARSLCGRGRLRAVVVKRGPRGAACVTSDGVLELAAHPAVVLDPTGAGDALAGGFLGACAAAERDDPGFFGEALTAGLRSAALAISGFGTEGLAGPHTAERGH
ncbi:MAG: PfkB family carbohydrate kinase [Candidatus Dormibacteria bacterium]